MREVERVVTLRVVDEFWMDHIDAMDDLRQGIRLRAYAQTDPVIEYKREGFEMFEAMNERDQGGDRPPRVPRPAQDERGDQARSAWQRSPARARGGDKTVKRQPVVKKIKVGPNDPVPLRQRQEVQKMLPR